MEQKEIFDTIREFLDLLQDADAEIDKYATINSLIKILDNLVIAYHYSKYNFDDNAIDPPSRDHEAYKKMRDLAQAKFPFLEYYAFVNPLRIDEPQFMIVDPFDDLADIACELQDVLWCIENTSEDDAIWHFRFGYESHWGRHTRHLQMYLYEISY